MREFHLTRSALTIDLEDRISVDETGFGRINGVSVLTSGPALGHGIDIDGQTVEAVTAALAGKTANWTHGNACDDALGQHLGEWENPVTENFVDPEGNDRVRTLADFAFAESSHMIKPDGLDVAAPVYLMQRAKEDPTTLGISIVANLELVEVEDSDPLARLLAAEDLSRADFVGNPAANEFGLSAKIFTGTPSELAEKATEKVNRMVAKFGKEKVETFLSKALGKQFIDLAEFAGLKTQLTALKAENKALKDSAVYARESEVEAFVDNLIVLSADRQNPITATQLESVRVLFDLGQDALAKNMGEALLGACGVQPKFGQTLTTLEDKPEDPKAKSIRAQVTMLRHSYPTKSYTIAEDGLSFTETLKV